MTENWSAGDLYEPYVGRWSRLVARQFLDWLGVTPGRDWLDVGCGTGALTQAILVHAGPGSPVPSHCLQGGLEPLGRLPDEPLEVR